MRKLYILKALTDYIWIICIISSPFILFICFGMFFNNNLEQIKFEFDGVEIELTNFWNKILILVYVFIFVLLLLAFYFFKKLLENFKKRLIFENNIVELLNKTGKFILISSFVYGASNLFILFQTNKASINFGFGPFIPFMHLK